MTDQADKLRKIADRLKQNRRVTRRSKNTRRIAISSGKGGVGKSSFTLNLAVALTKLKRKVLLIDADINLGNIDILLGISPKYLLRDLIEGRIELNDLLLTGPGGFTILPASSGDIDLLKQSEMIRQRIERELSQLELQYDYILVDTGAGIGNEVIDFALNSDEVIVVTTAEPTAFTDAYALIKVLISHAPNIDLKMVVNQVKDKKEAADIYKKIQMVVNHFLQSEIKDFGYLPKDDLVPRAIINQKPFFLVNEHAPVSKALWSIAMKVISTRSLTNKDKTESLFGGLMGTK